MEVSKVPPADVPTARAGTTTATGQESPSAANIAPLGNRADIRPLDIAGALQILLAEVRAGFDLPANTAIPQSPIVQSTIMLSPVQAAHDLVEMLLQVLPEKAGDAPAWTAALVRAAASLQSSIGRAMTILPQCRPLPPLAALPCKKP